MRTKEPIKESINGCNDNDDFGWYREESLGLEISPMTRLNTTVEERECHEEDGPGYAVEGIRRKTPRRAFEIDCREACDVGVLMEHEEDRFSIEPYGKNGLGGIM